MDAPVPSIEVTDYAQTARVGRPDRERDASDAAQLARMRAEDLVGTLVLELAEQVEVEVADGWEETVRIANRRRSAAAKTNLELVGEQLAPPLEPDLEDSRRMNARHFAPALLAVDEQHDAPRRRAETRAP